MKRIVRWLVALAAILAALYAAIFGIGLWISHGTGKQLDIGYGSSTSPSLVRLTIGDKVFVIPQNHIWSREDWKGGKVTGVNLHALLPDFEPYTEANRKEFDKSGPEQKINLLVREHNIAGSETTNASMTRRDVYERIIRDYTLQKQRSITESEGPFGLTMQRLMPPRTADDEMYTAYKEDGDFYWVRCSAEGSVPLPRCRTYIELSQHVTISYTFAKKYLSDWKAIDVGVVNFVRKFELNSEQGEQQ